MKPNRFLIRTLLLLCSSFSAHSVADEPAKVELIRVAELGIGPRKENSGIVKSRLWDDVYWMHNDSGDEPRVYPVRRSGKNYDGSRNNEGESGVYIGGAINVDWEDIAVDDSGHLIVADVGNNRNDRRDLVLYYLDEPSPEASRTTFKKKIFFHYPEQKDFPAPKQDFNYDCEGVFTVGNKVHLLTKHRSDSVTRLYRLDQMKVGVSNPLTLIGTFDVKGQAVAADASSDGKKLVIATYDRIWLFERKSLSTPFFNADVRCVRYESEQVEAICFAGEEALLLADEKLGVLFKLPLRSVGG